MSLSKLCSVRVQTRVRAKWRRSVDVDDFGRFDNTEQMVEDLRCEDIHMRFCLFHSFEVFDPRWGRRFDIAATCAWLFGRLLWTILGKASNWWPSSTSDIVLFCTLRHNYVCLDSQYDKNKILMITPASIFYSNKIPFENAVLSELMIITLIILVIIIIMILQKNIIRKKNHIDWSFSLLVRRIDWFALLNFYKQHRT